jgi:hypothetical protein
MSWAWMGQAHADTKRKKKLVRHAALKLVQFLKWLHDHN